MQRPVRRFQPEASLLERAKNLNGLGRRPSDPIDTIRLLGIELPGFFATGHSARRNPEERSRLQRRKVQLLRQAFQRREGKALADGLAKLSRLAGLQAQEQLGRTRSRIISKQEVDCHVATVAQPPGAASCSSSQASLPLKHLILTSADTEWSRSRSSVKAVMAMKGQGAERIVGVQDRSAAQLS